MENKCNSTHDGFDLEIRRKASAAGDVELQIHPYKHVEIAFVCLRYRDVNGNACTYLASRVFPVSDIDMA